MMSQFFQKSESKQSNKCSQEEINLLVKALENLANFPARERYRLIVDGQMHANGQGWIKFENREPGCLKGYFDGLAHALANLEDKELTLDLIKQIHRRCMTNVKVKIETVVPGERRDAPAGYQIGGGCDGLEGNKDAVAALLNKIQEEEKLYLKKGFKLMHIPEYKESKDNPLSIEENMKKYNIKDMDDFIAQILKVHKPRGGNGWGLWAPSPEISEKIALKLIENYNKTIEQADTKEKKIDAIINLIGGLEFTHYFADGNTRTLSVCLMQRLLIQAGLSPICWFSPNIWYVLPSKETIIQHINDGMKVTENILNGKKDIYNFLSESISHEEHSKLETYSAGYSETIKNEINRLVCNHNLLRH